MHDGLGGLLGEKALGRGLVQIEKPDMAALRVIGHAGERPADDIPAIAAKITRHRIEIEEAPMIGDDEIALLRIEFG